MKVVIVLTILLFAQIANSASVGVHYVDGTIDYVGTFLDSIVVGESKRKGFQKRTMVQGWSFKKRKVVPKLGMEIHWTLDDKEYQSTYTREKKL